MSIRTICKLLLAISAVTIFCSCAHFQKPAREAPADMSGEYSIDAGTAVVSNRWWKAFGDESLNSLMAEAWEGNPGLLQAAARLGQAEAVARKAGADKIPQVDLEGSARRTQSRIRGIQGEAFNQYVNSFDLNLAASYEIDLWGRIAATERAAVLDAQSSRDDLETAAMTLAARIADIWYTLGASSEKLELLNSQLESSKEQTRLLELRFQTGQATALDVWQQRGQQERLETIRPRLESSIATARHQLAVLLGRNPQETNDLQDAGLPDLPPKPRTGIPADLLANRPDVRAAMRRVRAADERVAVAIANRLPSLRLTASAGYSADEISDLFEDRIWNVVGNLLAPVIDGARRRAESDRTRAVLRERVYNYAEVLLDAVKEVEDALVEEQKQQELIERRQEQLEIATQTLKQARSRYRKGLSDYLSVLTAFEEKQSLQRDLVDDRRQLIAYRIQLHRALGGDFGAVVESAL